MEGEEQSFHLHRVVDESSDDEGAGGRPGLLAVFLQSLATNEASLFHL